ncbi:hypothetical protein [Hymenobacter sp. DG01]|uniref:hypothetical protein n=1 Tax=Hymenobacter sp. DG01 TaxID=2584940 RepID=UPI001123583F|nr:hypothetical protein [Hymenobacter sp. DG01]
MLVVEHSRLSVFDRSTWLISTPAGQHLLVNTAAAELFQILQQSSTTEQALARFNQTFQTTLATEQFTRLVAGRFGGYALLREEEGQPGLERSGLDHIALKVSLFSPAAAGRLAAPLRWLFSPALFWPLLGGQVLLLTAVFASNSIGSEAGVGEYAVAIPLLYGSILLHEAGHIAACARLGIRHGGIGFGFYGYVFPVLYADITGIWQATRAQRMIANLGGIYAQLLLSTGLALAYLGTPQPALLLASTSIAISAAWQFNPFIRRDGYWMLADLTNTPNLLSKASRTVKQAFTRASVRRVLTSKGKALLSRKLLWLLYGLGNTLFFLLLACWALYHHGPAIARFPGELPALMARVVQGTNPLTQQHLLAAAFYLVWGRFFLGLVLRRRATRLNQQLLAE